jgi:hypothetical protein
VAAPVSRDQMPAASTTVQGEDERLRKLRERLGGIDR